MPTNNFPGIGYITQGRDYNYFQKFTVANATYGGQSVDGYQPTDIITFSTQGIVLLLEAGGPVYVSYNGQTDHDELITTTFPMVQYNNRVVSMFWLRGSGTVSVRAWGIR
jgi:hypothetical protein